MRKVYWGCAAAALAVLGAWYANYHPDSLLGRCVVGACQAGVRVGCVYHVGAFLVQHANSSPGDPADELDCIPEEPEPIAEPDLQPCAVELEKTSVVLPDFDPNRGRLPGKIVIEDGQEPPLAAEERLSPEPSIERMVQRIEEQWWSDDTQASENAVRTMPYCEEGPTTAQLAMPYADEPVPAPRKHKKPEIWNPFPPKGTEVGGQENPELNPDGKDCREDPSAALQVPGCPQPTKAVPGGEEASEPPQPEKKKAKRAEPPKAKRTLDESRLLPFAAPIKLDTMDFRPSDWGKDDVALPPF